MGECRVVRRASDSNPADEHGKVHEQAPQHQAEEREGEHVDAASAVQRGEREADDETQPEQQGAQPPGTARQREHRVDDGNASRQPSVQKLRAGGEEALRFARQGPGPAFGAGGSASLAPASGGIACGGRAIRGRKQRALAVSVLDGLDEQDGARARAPAWRDGSLRATLSVSRPSRRAPPDSGS